jgi:hypothetical protein
MSIDLANENCHPGGDVTQQVPLIGVLGVGIEEVDYGGRLQMSVHRLFRQ